jgi:hypothetical protein
MSQLQWQAGEGAYGAATTPAGRVSVQEVTKWTVRKYFKIKKLILCAQHTVHH